MATALEELENQINDKINSENKMMDALAEQSATKDSQKLKELHKRLATHNEHMRRRLGEAGVADEAEAPGADSGMRGASTATPSDVLSSPTIGSTPRYVPQSERDPDPVAEAAPRPPSEADGRTDRDDPPMGVREQMAQQRQAQAAPQKAPEPHKADDKKK